MNLIDQGKTIMQGLEELKWRKALNKQDNLDWNKLEAKASQMLIDLTNEKEWLGRIDTFDLDSIEMEEGLWMDNYILDRLKEINSAIEILEGRDE